MVELNPEKFGHRMMDKAIHITDLKKENIKKPKRNLFRSFQTYLEKIKRLQRQNLLNYTFQMVLVLR